MISKYETALEDYVKFTFADGPWTRTVYRRGPCCGSGRKTGSALPPRRGRPTGATRPSPPPSALDRAALAQQARSPAHARRDLTAT